MNTVQIQVVNSAQEPTQLMTAVIAIILLIGLVLVIVGYSGSKPLVSFKVLFFNLFDKQKIKVFGFDVASSINIIAIANELGLNSRISTSDRVHLVTAVNDANNSLIVFNTSLFDFPWMHQLRNPLKPYLITFQT